MELSAKAKAAFPKLLGGAGTFGDDRPEPTVGSYWPFVPTLWDYINRAMPMPAPHTLSADDVYALTVFAPNLNNVVPNEFVADRESLPKVKMPNRDNFISTDPRPDTQARPCMNACGDPLRCQDRVHGRRQKPHAAHERTARHDATEINATEMDLRETPLTSIPSTKTILIPALALALSIGIAASVTPAATQSAVAAEGQKLAFDRGKGNCLSCHQIKGGDFPGTIGPALTDIKSKYPNRDDLVAILFDETKRNPETVMPPFGRNRILTDKEINAIVDFLQTL